MQTEPISLLQIVGRLCPELTPYFNPLARVLRTISPNLDPTKTYSDELSRQKPITNPSDRKG
jgi:hypothetical protein